MKKGPLHIPPTGIYPADSENKTADRCSTSHIAHPISLMSLCGNGLWSIPSHKSSLYINSENHTVNFGLDMTHLMPSRVKTPYEGDLRDHTTTQDQT